MTKERLQQHIDNINQEKEIEGVIITMKIDQADLNSGNEIKTLLVDFYSGDIPIPPIKEALKQLLKQLEEDDDN